jgi:glycine/D-amino acid oxidase-like deaminating enzyme/nitrite reductase/ring-hydroxylating ferredoxin subunit
MNTPESKTSLWHATSVAPHLTQMLGNASTDVCIIGAGIAGLSVAYELLKAGMQVIVLESKTIGYGETGNTSAHLSNALDDRFFNLENMHGLDKAHLAASSHRDAIDRIEAICKAENIECDFERVAGYLFAANESDHELLAKEFFAAKRCGIDISKTTIKNLGECLNFPRQAIFHPLKYLHGLAAAVIKLGGKIYENTPVVELQKEPLQVKTETGYTVTANKIVAATNAPFFSSLVMHMKLDPQRSYVIGLKVPKNSVKNALYWDTANPYHYVRIARHDEQNDTLIVGGKDHRVGCQPEDNLYENLKIWAEQYFAITNSEIIWQWSGQVLEPVDYLAYIGENPKAKNVYMVTGDSGNGLTHGVIAGMLISDLIQAKTNPWTDVYKLNRMPIHAIPSLLSNAWASTLGYIKYLCPQFGATPNIGEGKIMQRGFKKVAVYRDEHNNLHECSGICSHMQAVLSWNPKEKSWDCPAHGSRFDLEGNKLNGPATTGIKCSATKK